MGPSTLIKTIGIGIIVLLIRYSLDAESYQQWLNYPPSSGISIEFNAFGNFVDNAKMAKNLDLTAPRRITEKGTAIKLTRPSGGYIGSLHLRPLPSTQLRYPLSVTLIYTEVLSDDLDKTGNLNREVSIRNEYYHDTFHIGDQDSRTEIPMVLPRFFYYRMAKGSVYLSCRLDIKDNDGKILGRYLCIDRISSDQTENPTGWVMDESEADRFLREYAGIQNFQTIESLPSHLNPFSEIAALWISEAHWEQSPLTSQYLQRLLLMGVWLYGRQSTVESIAASLGLTTPYSVLLGGIGVPNELSFQTLWSYSSGHAWRSLVQHDGYYNSDDKRTLLSKEHIFQSYRRSYIIWTWFWLIGFSLILLIGTPLAFNLLKGEKRLHLWWAVPVISLLTATIGWGIGNLYLPRKPIVEITEFRFAHALWPEIYVQDVIRILSFNREDVDLSLPENGFSLPSINWRAIRRKTNTKTDYYYSDHPKTRFRWMSLLRGDVSEREIASFKRADLPLEFDRDNNQLKLRALQDFSRVFVWDNTQWHHLGKLRRGDVIDPLNGRTTGQLYGMPLTLSSLFKYGKDTRLAENIPYSHGQSSSLRSRLDHAAALENRIENQGAFPNSLVIIGISDEPPLISLNSQAVLPYSKVVWIMQVPTGDKESTQNK